MGDRWTDEMVDELLHGAPIVVSERCIMLGETRFVGKMSLKETLSKRYNVFKWDRYFLSFL